MFFNAMVKAFGWSLVIALFAIFFGAVGISIFAAALQSYLGFVLFYCLILAFVLWKDY